MSLSRCRWSAGPALPHMEQTARTSMFGNRARTSLPGTRRSRQALHPAFPGDLTHQCRSGLDVRANRERCLGSHDLTGYQHKATTYKLAFGPAALKSSLSTRFKSMDRSDLARPGLAARANSVTSALLSAGPRPGLQQGQRDPGAQGTQRISRPQTTIGAEENMRQTEHRSSYANWGFQPRQSNVRSAVVWLVSEDCMQAAGPRDNKSNHIRGKILN